jgi:hypothetical protein
VTTTVITRKVCFKCQVEKALTEFYVHPAMGDGRLNKCKECARKDVRTNYEANADHYRAYDRKRGYRPGDPHKVAARNAVNKAVLAGLIEKKKCEVGIDCRGRIEAHHDDYTKPLEVRWLCKKHHGEVHTQQEQEVA